MSNKHNVEAGYFYVWNQGKKHIYEATTKLQ